MRYNDTLNLHENTNMSMPKYEPIFTVDEYLALERSSEERHVYVDGEIFMMAGESIAHARISVNLVAVIAAQLNGSSCEALSKDTKVRSGPTPMSSRQTSGMFSYPDLVVVCGEPEFHDAYKDVIVNPTAIMEVLSPTTEAFDRGDKFAHYRDWNSSLKDYLLVSQAEPRVDHYVRQPDNSWSVTFYTGLEAVVAIPAIGCTLKLADVYKRMSMPRYEPIYTVDEYLALERSSEERHVYVDGEIFMMAGESLPHGKITANLMIRLGSQLIGSSCQALSKDTKVRSGPTPMDSRQTAGMFSYPDLVVVCGEPEFHDAYQDVILNPKVIIEALSPTAEAFDRGEKFVRYRQWNPTLSDYLLVSQKQPLIEHFVRQPDGSWSLRSYVGLETTLAITSIGCTLKLADVYDRITFSDA